MIIPDLSFAEKSQPLRVSFPPRSKSHFKQPLKPYLSPLPPSARREVRGHVSSSALPGHASSRDATDRRGSSPASGIEDGRLNATDTVSSAAEIGSVRDAAAGTRIRSRKPSASCIRRQQYHRQRGRRERRLSSGRVRGAGGDGGGARGERGCVAARRRGGGPAGARARAAGARGLPRGAGVVHARGERVRGPGAGGVRAGRARARALRDRRPRRVNRRDGGRLHRAQGVPRDPRGAGGGAVRGQARGATGGEPVRHRHAAGPALHGPRVRQGHQALAAEPRRVPPRVHHAHLAAERTKAHTGSSSK